MGSAGLPWLWPSAEGSGRPCQELGQRGQLCAHPALLSPTSASGLPRGFAGLLPAQRPQGHPLLLPLKSKSTEVQKASLLPHPICQRSGQSRLRSEEGTRDAVRVCEVGETVAALFGTHSGPHGLGMNTAVLETDKQVTGSDLL